MTEDLKKGLLEIVCRRRYQKLEEKLKANLERIPEEILKTEYPRAYEDVMHEMYGLSKYVDFGKLQKEKTSSETLAEGDVYILPAKDAKELEEGLYRMSMEDFERHMQEWLRKDHRAAFATDITSDKEQSKGSGQDGEILSVLKEIKDILERIEGTASAATLEPGVVVNLATTCAPGMTKEDIQTHCRFSQEEFDKVLQDYVKREAKITYASGMGGGAPGVGITIPCPPPTHTPDTEGAE